MAIHNDLVEAYLGYHEDDLVSEYAYCSIYDTKVKKSGASFDDWAKANVEKKIRGDSPRDRLMVYLEWNGIIGYTGRIFEIATGQFEG